MTGVSERENEWCLYECIHYETFWPHNYLIDDEFSGDTPKL